jgi:hypothetical protein
VISHCRPCYGRPGGCSISALSTAGLIMSAALSPTAVSSLTCCQVPGPHPAVPTCKPRELPSWGSRAKSFGNHSLMNWVIKVLIRQVGRLTRSPISEVNAVGSFVGLSPLPGAWFTFTAGDRVVASEDTTSPSCLSRFLPLLPGCPLLPALLWAT